MCCHACVACSLSCARLLWSELSMIRSIESTNAPSSVRPRPDAIEGLHTRFCTFRLLIPSKCLESINSHQLESPTFTGTLACTASAFARPCRHRQSYFLTCFFAVQCAAFVLCRPRQPRLGGQLCILHAARIYTARNHGLVHLQRDTRVPGQHVYIRARVHPRPCASTHVCIRARVVCEEGDGMRR